MPEDVDHKAILYESPVRNSYFAAASPGQRCHVGRGRRRTRAAAGLSLTPYIAHIAPRRRPVAACVRCSGSAGPLDILEKPPAERRLALCRTWPPQNLRSGRTNRDTAMITNSDKDSIHSQTRPPRVRDMPRCSICTDPMVAPEASVLQPTGEVCYLWSCDKCGQGFVTRAAA
jgi:hypothetical protein